MSPCTSKVLSGITGVLIFVLTNSPLPAQDAKATLSGVVTDSSSKVVANAKVSIKNFSTGQVGDVVGQGALLKHPLVVGREQFWQRKEQE